MSKDFTALGVAALTEKSFENLPSKKHLITILKSHGDLAIFNSLHFEWLDDAESQTLHTLLINHARANKDFKSSEEGTTIKLNIIEWLHVYNLFLGLKKQKKLTPDEEALLLKFNERFEYLVQKNPLDKSTVQSFPRTKGEDGRIFRIAELGVNCLLVLSGLLVLANLYLDMKAISIVTLFTIVFSSLFILYKEKIKKIALPESNFIEMYTQMLLDSSY